MFLTILLVLAVLSVVFAVLSLRKINHQKEIEEVKKKLEKGRVVFQDSSSSGGI